MSKAENYIRKNTNQFSNEDGFDYVPWLTPNQARRAVEIAREEMVEWIDSHWREYVNVDADGVVCFGHWKNDLRNAMKDE